jgi:hypothetical protein
MIVRSHIEFSIFNTNRQLSALQTAATILGHVSEKKLLIYSKAFRSFSVWTEGVVGGSLAA